MTYITKSENHNKLGGIKKGFCWRAALFQTEDNFIPLSQIFTGSFWRIHAQFPESKRREENEIQVWKQDHNAWFQWPPCKVFVLTKDLPGIWIFDAIEGGMAVHCKPLLANNFIQT